MLLCSWCFTAWLRLCCPVESCVPYRAYFIFAQLQFFCIFVSLLFYPANTCPRNSSRLLSAFFRLMLTSGILKGTESSYIRLVVRSPHFRSSIGALLVYIVGRRFSCRRLTNRNIALDIQSLSSAVAPISSTIRSTASSIALILAFAASPLSLDSSMYSCMDMNFTGILCVFRISFAIQHASIVFPLPFVNE